MKRPSSLLPSENLTGTSGTAIDLTPPIPGLVGQKIKGFKTQQVLPFNSATQRSVTMRLDIPCR